MTRKSLPPQGNPNGATSRITIREVASEAGVSVATVSRVLANIDVVREATRQKVQDAVDRLDYQINPHARALAGGGNRAVAFLVRDIFGPSFASLAKGVEEEAADNGHLFLMSTTRGEPDRESELISMMRVQGTSAVILVGGARVDEEYEQQLAGYSDALESAGSRLVLCGRPQLSNRPNVATVQYDNVGAGRLVTEHLLDLGHRRILFVTNDDQNTNQERLIGYQQALESSGVDFVPELVIHQPLTDPDSAAVLVEEALANGLQFTAIVAVTDAVAVAIMGNLRRAGVHIPAEISLTGINDERIASDYEPALTTVHIPFEEVGRRTAQLALAQPSAYEIHQVVPVRLVVRDSTGPMNP